MIFNHLKERLTRRLYTCQISYLQHGALLIQMWIVILIAPKSYLLHHCPKGHSFKKFHRNLFLKLSCQQSKIRPKSWVYPIQYKCGLWSGIGPFPLSLSRAFGKPIRIFRPNSPPRSFLSTNIQAEKLYRSHNEIEGRTHNLLTLDIPFWWSARNWWFPLECRCCHRDSQGG